LFVYEVLVSSNAKFLSVNIVSSSCNYLDTSQTFLSLLGQGGRLRLVATNPINKAFCLFNEVYLVRGDLKCLTRKLASLYLLSISKHVRF